MSRNYKIHDQTDLHYLTYATVGWVDVLTRPAYKDIVVESLPFCQREKGLELFAWCIMSNHVHLIARAKEGHRLQDIMRDHKTVSYTHLDVYKRQEYSPGKQENAQSKTVKVVANTEPRETELRITAFVTPGLSLIHI